jgi:hypothetical protein
MAIGMCKYDLKVLFAQAIEVHPEGGACTRTQAMMAAATRWRQTIVPMPLSWPCSLRVHFPLRGTGHGGAA